MRARGTCHDGYLTLQTRIHRTSATLAPTTLPSADKIRLSAAVSTTVMPDIQIDIAAPLAWVTLNRPDKRNALSTAMWRRLSPLAAELGNRSDLRVVLLRGAGGTFSAGADIAQMQAQLGDAAAMR
ncbi:MAG: enoyl-CoA hydratase/isomerase family protein, partial [Gammaproteobacteria bacterium]|nr:enoyl-CoA hydratase/isomerase family protein [Gammaproteobacteria bacterium]